MKSVIFFIILQFSPAAFSEKLSSYETALFQKNIEERIAKKTEDFRAIYPLYKEMLHSNYKKFISRNIIGLELLIAGPSHERVESVWGHSLLRFVDDNSDPFDDLVVSFVADVNEYKMSLLKGVAGGYKRVPELSSLGYFIQIYIEGQGREIERIPIQSSQEIRNKIKNLIIKDFKFANQNYKFFSSNCATSVHDLLTYAGYPEGALVALPIPTYLKPIIKDRMASPYLGYKFSTLFAVYDYLSKKLNIPVKNVKKGILPDESLPILLALEPIYLTRYYVEIGIKNKNIAPQVLTHIQTLIKEGLDPYAQVQSFPVELYQFCSNKNCAEKQVSIVKQLWPEGYDRFNFNYIVETYVANDLHKSGFVQTPAHLSFKLYTEAIARSVNYNLQ